MFKNSILNLGFLCACALNLFSSGIHNSSPVYEKMRVAVASPALK